MKKLLAVAFMVLCGFALADNDSDSARALREIQQMRDQYKADRQSDEQQRRQQQQFEQMRKLQQENWDANQKKINCDWGRC